MKFMDKDDLKKNIKENLNVKKKRDSLHDQMPASNGVNHSNSGSLDRLSPFPNRSPAGPSPNVSTQHCHRVMQVKSDRVLDLSGQAVKVLTWYARGPAFESCWRLN